jgi:GTP-binding protein YchF
VKVVIAGMPQAGQQHLFSLLTGIPLGQVSQKSFEVQPGVCPVRDPRIDRLTAIFHPKKTTYARIDFLLLPDFTLQGPSKALIFNELKNADEICWVSRREGAEADIAGFVSELVISDLLLAEKRLENLAKEQKKKYAEAKEKEARLIEQCKKQLEVEKPLRDLKISDEQYKMLRAYQFLTLKPIVLVVNVPEDKIKDDTIAKKLSFPSVILSAELEEEISRLEEGEREEFTKELGIEEPALHKMTRVVFEGLGLISFFTTGSDEVRAWPLKKGASAQEAAAAIHSDIEKGFVRAELMQYDDFILAGSETKLKETGKFFLKGRDYVVEDGDILNFRFNV